MLRRALLLVLLAGTAATPQEDRLTTSIYGLIKKQKKSGLNKAEAQKLYEHLNTLEENTKSLWKGMSAEQINVTRESKYWKHGQAALLDHIKSEAGKRVGGKVGFMSSGKHFLDKGFHPGTSDLDLTVLGPNGKAAQEAIADVAPQGYMERRNMSVMDADGNFNRFRGSVATTMTAEQMTAAREKQMAQKKSMAGQRGGYVSTGGVAGVESKLAHGKYSGEVEFFSKEGKNLGKVHITDLKGVGSGFGVVNPAAGDLLGAASDNLAQMKNYVADKGNKMLGIVKTMERQMEVLKQLPPNLQKEFAAAYPGLTQTLNKISQGDSLQKLSRLSPDALKQMGINLNQFSDAAGDVAKLAGQVGQWGVLGKPTGGSLRLEDNLIGAIMNTGDLERFKSIHKNNKPLMEAVQRVEAIHGAKLQGLIDERNKALGAMAEESDKGVKAFIKTLEGISPRLAARLGETLQSLPLPALMEILPDLAISTYSASQGDVTGALNNLSEGLVSMAVPGAAIPLIARDLSVMAMNYAADKLLSAVKDPRLNRAYAEIVGDPSNPDVMAELLHGVKSQKEMLEMIEKRWVDSAKAIEMIGWDSKTERELQKKLADRLWDMRPSLKRLEDYRIVIELMERGEKRREERRRAEALRRIKDAARDTTPPAAALAVSLAGPPEVKPGDSAIVRLVIEGGKPPFTVEVAGTGVVIKWKPEPLDRRGQDIAFSVAADAAGGDVSVTVVDAEKASGNATYTFGAWAHPLEGRFEIATTGGWNSTFEAEFVVAGTYRQPKFLNWSHGRQEAFNGIFEWHAEYDYETRSIIKGWLAGYVPLGDGTYRRGNGLMKGTYDPDTGWSGTWSAKEEYTGTTLQGTWTGRWAGKLKEKKK